MAASCRLVRCCFMPGAQDNPHILPWSLFRVARTTRKGCMYAICTPQAQVVRTPGVRLVNPWVGFLAAKIFLCKN